MRLTTIQVGNTDTSSKRLYFCFFSMNHIVKTFFSIFSLKFFSILLYLLLTTAVAEEQQNVKSMFCYKLQEFFFFHLGYMQAVATFWSCC